LEAYVTSPWIPLEWIKAHGFEPRGPGLGNPEEPTAVPEGVCAFAQHMADLARSHADAPVIFTTACDQLRRAADACRAGDNSRLFLFNLPATWQTSASRRLYQAEIARLGKFLEGLGGRSPTDASLLEIIRDYEQRRAELVDFIQCHPACEALEAMAGYFDGAVQVPSGGVSAARSRAAKAGAASRSRATVSAGVPLALVGGPLLPSQWTLLEAIESAGGSVVLTATEPGERCLLPPLPPHADAPCPLTALANHYFDHAVDVFHRPNSRLYDWLRSRLTERCVRGMVLWVHVGCDLWRAEAASLREAFQLPVLTLDTHEVRGGGLRDANRLAAFLEMLQ
jgi:benzoyl-CoA reductase/2-hydroxyglutaryl-CoA dehydratase subunit BcrC/BadD/HgdB